jgi:sortase (surface protein transpeptidase)
MKSEEKKMKQMQKMMTSPNQSQDPMEAMMEIMIESCKQNDEIFFEHGIEEDDFNAAVMHYNLQDDPEVRAMMMRSMQALGMGGMMGR